MAGTPLGRTVATTATDVWNDSCSIPDLEYAVSFGAVGATANPTIVNDVWKQEPMYWRERARALAAEGNLLTEVELGWAVVEAMSLRAAPLLLPAHAASRGRQGRLSIQTDPTLYRSPEWMMAQAQRFAGLAPNIIVKLPATRAGIHAIEWATATGVSVNVTVCFSVSQAVAAAEAIERGLRRYDAVGGDIEGMGPVVTIMVGRIEDWLRIQTERDGIVADPEALPWSGVAVFKRAYEVFNTRGFRARLLAAAIRHHRHWSEFIGGDVVITLPPIWQRRFNASDIEVRARMDDPVDPVIVRALETSYADFRHAHEPGALSIDEFDAFPPTARTLRAFIASYHELLQQVTDATIPNPDVRPA